MVGAGLVDEVTGAGVVLGVVVVGNGVVVVVVVVGGATEQGGIEEATTVHV